jgi:hypothetical protein
MADEPAEALLSVSVDWERQSEETILVVWSLGEHTDSEAWVFGKPSDVKNVALCGDVESAAEALLQGLPGALETPLAPQLYRVILVAGVPGVKTIYGQPGRPVVIQRADAELGPAIGRLSAAALALATARLGG